MGRTKLFLKITRYSLHLMYLGPLGKHSQIKVKLKLKFRNLLSYTVSTNSHRHISKNLISSIFIVINSLFIYCLAQKWGTPRFFEASVLTCHSAWCKNPEDLNFSTSSVSVSDLAEIKSYPWKP